MLLVHFCIIISAIIMLRTARDDTPLMHARFIDILIFLFFVGIACFSLVMCVKYFIEIGRDEVCGNETLDALLCSEIPQVVNYCESVRRQGRMLTMPEAKALLEICRTNPDAFKKVAASYEKHDEKHPYTYYV